MTVREEALNVFGSVEGLRAMAERYFSSIHHRITILSKKRVFERLPTVFDEPNADYMTLCLCMRLVQEQPLGIVESMQSSLYVTIKGIMSLLAATGAHSLDMVQCWVLMTFYELGHAIFPACSMSLAACVKLARGIGIQQRDRSREDIQISAIEVEERSRVWWAVYNLERFLNLCDGDALFGTAEPKSETPLPVEDRAWAADIVPEAPRITLATPSSISVGQFARECQASHLAGRIVGHVFHPTSDQAFQSEEAVQLKRTLMALMPLLVEEERQFGKYCAALGICSNALFTLYEYSPAPIDEDQKLTAMEPVSTQIAEFSAFLFGDVEKIEYPTLSPLVPYSLYQAAVVQFRLWKRHNKDQHRNNLNSLKRILSYFNQRWLVAGL
jgi:hypothetical protein